jgi:hypothetical protein
LEKRTRIKINGNRTGIDAVRPVCQAYPHDFQRRHLLQSCNATRQDATRGSHETGSTSDPATAARRRHDLPQIPLWRQDLLDLLRQHHHYNLVFFPKKKFTWLRISTSIWTCTFGKNYSQLHADYEVICRNFGESF